MENISYIYIYQFNNQPPEWDTIQTQSVMKTKNQNKINDLIQKARHILNIVSNDGNVESINFMKHRISLMESLKTNEDFESYIKEVNN